MTFSTADLSDEHGDDALIVVAPWRSFGRHVAFGGLARTVECFEDNSRVREALEQPGEGHVLVVDGGGSERYALLGDRLATLGFENGWAGVVVYGCVRDSAVIDTMPFGVKALGTVPRRSKKLDTGTTDEPVTIGDVTITNGDMVVADADGVIVLPRPS